MKLGTFSISLSVSDISVSLGFYEKLGFSVAGGDVSQNWLILRNGECTVGLFQGMFEKNIMTFSPGWNNQAEPVEEFPDVREIQQSLKDQGIELMSEIESETGPGSFMVEDPDGNTILFDQHV